MQRADLRPDVVSYALLVSAYGRARREDEALHVFEEMLSAGVRWAPSCIHFLLLLGHKCYFSQAPYSSNNVLCSVCIFIDQPKKPTTFFLMHLLYLEWWSKREQSSRVWEGTGQCLKMCFCNVFQQNRWVVTNLFIFISVIWEKSFVVAKFLFC